MAGSRFTDYDQFHREVLRARSGPMMSPIEEMADEMYHQEVQEEFDKMWDSVDSEDEE